MQYAIISQIYIDSTDPTISYVCSAKGKLLTSESGWSIIRIHTPASGLLKLATAAPDGIQDYVFIADNRETYNYYSV